LSQKPSFPTTGHPCEKILRCARSSSIYAPNLNFLAFTVSVSWAVRRTWLVRSTNDHDQEYIDIIMWETLSSTCYNFPTNLVFSFTLRVTGIIILTTTQILWRKRNKYTTAGGPKVIQNIKLYPENHTGS